MLKITTDFVMRLVHTFKAGDEAEKRASIDLKFFRLRLPKSVITISSYSLNNKTNLHLTKGRKMKQLLVIAIALTAINAQASRARVQALGNAAHLVDTNTVFTNPADIFALPSDYVVLETGTTQGTPAGVTAQNSNAEGMIVRTMGDAKLGLSLGHQSQNASTWGLRNAATAALQINQQNPLELTYGAKAGDLAWAGTLVYSNFNDKAAAVGVVEKENSLGARFGVRAANWDASLRLGLANVVQANTGNKFTGTSAIGLSGGYWFDNLYVHGGYTTVGAKEETNAGVEVLKLTNSAINVGALSSMKKDGSELFYGVQLVSTENKETVADSKTTTLTLPVVIGLEVDAASWLTFRGSVTQTTLINDSKTETAGTTTANTSPGDNTTAVNLGAGLKFNKLTIDGTLGTATTQTVNTTALMAQVGATYWF